MIALLIGTLFLRANARARTRASLAGDGFVTVVGDKKNRPPPRRTHRLPPRIRADRRSGLRYQKKGNRRGYCQPPSRSSNIVSESERGGSECLDV